MFDDKKKRTTEKINMWLRCFFACCHCEPERAKQSHRLLRRFTPRNDKMGRIGFIILFLLSSATISQAAVPRKDVKEGNRFYEEGDYEASKEKYMEALEKAPESDIVHFNLGTALYKKGEYQEAVDHFQKALLSEDDELKEKAYYNSGNALYKYGITREHEGAALVVPSLEKSLSQYERALQMDKDDQDTKHNYAFVKKELKRIREQQQQQPQQGQQEDSEENKDQEQKQQGQQSQEQQDQQQQSQQQEQEDQEKSDQERGQTGEEDYNEQQGADAQQQSAEELTREEAQMRLESYQQTEEPQEKLNIFMKKMDTRPVKKDW